MQWATHLPFLFALPASVATQPAPDPRAPEGSSKVILKEPPVVGPVTPEELLVAIHLLEFVKDPNITPEQPSSMFTRTNLLLTHK